MKEEYKKVWQEYQDRYYEVHGYLPIYVGHITNEYIERFLYTGKVDGE